MSNHLRANSFEPTLSSGVWEGLSFRQGCEGLDETRWTQTSLVFTDIRKGGRLTPRGEAPAWGREEPGSAIFRLCGKGISHWRGRQIHFALRGFVEPAGAGDQHLRITLIKRHNGSFHNIVHYGGTLSQNGSSIQGTFADGHFRLRQVDPVSHVLARELTGAWDGESSCRRGGQSSTTWKSVRLAFQPLPPGDGRGWGMLVTGGGDSLWNKQRIPFCITGRLSLPGLEVELEKQHVEGYHNRIAYFGRVLSGVSADKIDGPPDGSPPPTRLVGVYEHGDFILHRNPNADLDSSGTPLSDINGGSGKSGAGGGEELSVLEACINLFRRSSDSSSVWGKAPGLPRPAIVPPMARSHSGDGGLPGGPGTLVPPGILKHQHQHQHPSAARVLPMNGDRGGVGVRAVGGGGPPMTTSNGLPRNFSVLAGNPPSYHSSPSSSSSLDGRSVAAATVPPGWGGEDGVRGGQGRGGAGPSTRWRGDGGESSSNGGGGGSSNTDRQLSRIDAVSNLPSSSPTRSRFVTARGHGGGDGGGYLAGGEAGGGGMAWDFKESTLGGWQQPNAGTCGSSNGTDRRVDSGGSSMAGSAWNSAGVLGDIDSGGGVVGRETRVGNMRPVDNDSNGAAAAAMMNRSSSFAHDGRGSWGGGDAGKRDEERRRPAGDATAAGANGAASDDRSAGRMNIFEYTDSRHHQLSGSCGGDTGGVDASGAGSDGITTTTTTATTTTGNSNSNSNSNSKAGLGLDGMNALRMSLADPRGAADEGCRQETATSAALSAATVAHLHQLEGGGGAGGYLNENGVGVGGRALSPFKFASAAALATPATSVSSPATFNSTDSSAGSGVEGSAGMAPLATISAAATAAAAAAAATDADRNCVAGQVGGGGNGTTATGGGGGREDKERCKMCWTGPLDALLLPCGHLGLCQSCAGVLSVCPICKADIYRVQPVYRS
eukprot:g13162.t1